MRKCVQDVPEKVTKIKLPPEYIQWKLGRDGIETQTNTPLKQKSILQRSKDPDYFLEKTNEQLGDIINEVVRVRVRILKKLDQMEEEILSIQRLVRPRIKKKGE